MQLGPDFSAGLVGAIQWVVTGFYGFLTAFSSLGLYLTTTGESYSIDGTPVALVFLSIVALAGFGRGYHNPNGHGKRIEVLVWLLVLGFFLPTGLYFVLPVFGLSMLGTEFFAVAIMAYVLTLVLAYGLVYGLDLQVFLPEESESEQE